MCIHEYTNNLSILVMIASLTQCWCSTIVLFNCSCKLTRKEYSEKIGWRANNCRFGWTFSVRSTEETEGMKFTKAIDELCLQNCEWYKKKAKITPCFLCPIGFLSLPLSSRQVPCSGYEHCWFWVSNHTVSFFLPLWSLRLLHNYLV